MSPSCFGGRRSTIIAEIDLSILNVALVFSTSVLLLFISLLIPSESRERLKPGTVS